MYLVIAVRVKMFYLHSNESLFMFLRLIASCTLIAQVHPLVLNTAYSSLQAPLLYTTPSLVYFYVGNVVFSYAAALLLCLAVEAPLAAIEKRFFT